MIKYKKQHSYVKKASSKKVNQAVIKKRIPPHQYFNSTIYCQILPKVRVKQKLTIDEQITYMKYKGITFNVINEKDAKEVLSKTNYYYKLSVVRKLFEKNFSNKYKLLDFSLLVDLSSIDMGVRYFLLQLCLDIEHSIKVTLIEDLTANPKIDPYRIVKQFKNKNKSFYNKVVSRFQNTTYMEDMYSKRGKDIPYWVLLEILDMGGLIKFLKFYIKNNKATTKINTTSDIAIYAKNIRNCCAHSSPFIYNIFDSSMFLYNPNSKIVTYGHSIGIKREEIKYKKINDLVALFYLHKFLCTDVLNTRRAKEGKKLMGRSLRKREYYYSNDKLKKTKKVFSKLLDYLSR